MGGRMGRKPPNRLERAQTPENRRYTGGAHAAKDAGRAALDCTEAGGPVTGGGAILRHETDTVARHIGRGRVADLAAAYPSSSLATPWDSARRHFEPLADTG